MLDFNPYSFNYWTSNSVIWTDTTSAHRWLCSGGRTKQSNGSSELCLHGGISGQICLFLLFQKFNIFQTSMLYYFSFSLLLSLPLSHNYNASIRSRIYKDVFLTTHALRDLSPPFGYLCFHSTKMY